MQHLNSETLIGFAEGRLTPEDKLPVEQHISSCPLCFAEASEWFLLLDSMKESTLESAPEHAIRNCFAIYNIPKPVSVLRQLYAAVVFDSANVAAVAGVRGATDSQQILFRTGDVDLDLRIGGNPRVILGQILQRRAGHFLAGVPVGLCQADGQIESTISDTLGEFRFGIAPAGKLRLHADLPAYRLIGDFTIKEKEIK
jgi:hypothetical protein